MLDPTAAKKVPSFVDGYRIFVVQGGKARMRDVLCPRPENIYNHVKTSVIEILKTKKITKYPQTKPN